MIEELGLKLRDANAFEANLYRRMAADRDKEGFLALFKQFPGVLWGTVSSSLSEEERNWTASLLDSRKSRPRDDNFGWFDE
jgi:hypothetical protein